MTDENRSYAQMERDDLVALAAVMFRLDAAYAEDGEVHCTHCDGNTPKVGLAVTWAPGSSGEAETPARTTHEIVCFDCYHSLRESLDHCTGWPLVLGLRMYTMRTILLALPAKAEPDPTYVM